MITDLDRKLRREFSSVRNGTPFGIGKLVSESSHPSYQFYMFNDSNLKKSLIGIRLVPRVSYRSWSRFIQWDIIERPKEKRTLGHFVTAVVCSDTKFKQTDLE